MKSFVSIIVALGIAFAFTVPASAMMMKAPKTHAACEKAHMMWHAGKCMKGKM